MQYIVRGEMIARGIVYCRKTVDTFEKVYCAIFEGVFQFFHALDGTSRFHQRRVADDDFFVVSDDDT